jgi:aminoglycoside 3-N-acetyltransferase I
MPPFEIKRLGPADTPRISELNAMFGEAFGEPETYADAPPDRAWLEAVLAKAHVIVLVALQDDAVVGGLVAYELDKLEQARREIYLYDLAVAGRRRRQGIATALIRRLQEIAASRGAWVVFVQADYQDAPAVALYEMLGVREEVLHYDLKPPR